MRPANIITAISDILAGVAIAAYFTGNRFDSIPLLPGLYWYFLPLVCMEAVWFSTMFLMRNSTAWNGRKGQSPAD
jgi:hypothetical protein